MQTLELECPSCGERLELDAGFAGGVCRCASCGTLMTVPTDAGQAEQLSAPARPAAGEGPAVSPDDLRPITPDHSGSTRAGRGKTKRNSKAGSRPDSKAIQSGEYRTATGRVVHIEGATRVPMARGKKQKVRIATTTAFIAVLLLIVVVAVIAIVAIVGPAEPTGTADRATNNNANTEAENTDAPPVYDARANPYTVDYPNLFGLPLSGRVSIVIEASRDSGYWMAQASDVIQAGLRRRGQPASVALFAATANEPTPFGGGKHKPPAQINASLLGSWFAGLPSEREVDRLSAIDAAMTAKPDTLILVISAAGKDEVEQWQERVAEQEDITVHAVLVDGLSRPLRAWLRSRDGSEFISLRSDQFETWQAEAETKQR